MKILLADDHDIVIDGLAQRIQKNGISSSILKAYNGEEALKLALLHAPDIIISDYMMEGMNGLELLINVRREGIKSKFLVVSMLDEASMVETLIEQGADGFMNKESAADEMIYGIMQIAEGKTFFCKMTQEILKKSRRGNTKDIALSRRELEVLRMVMDEMKNTEIAEELNISVSTVETHKKNMIKKVGARNSIGLVRYTIENNIFG